MRHLIFAYKFSTGRDVYRAQPDTTPGFLFCTKQQSIQSYLHLFKLNVYLNFLGIT